MCYDTFCIQGDEVWASYAQATVASSCNANRFASYVTCKFCLPDSGCQLEVQFQVVVRVVQVVHHSNFKFKLELQVEPVGAMVWGCGNLKLRGSLVVPSRHGRFGFTLGDLESACFDLKITLTSAMQHERIASVLLDQLVRAMAASFKLSFSCFHFP